MVCDVYRIWMSIAWRERRFVFGNGYAPTDGFYRLISGDIDASRNVAKPQVKILSDL